MKLVRLVTGVLGSGLVVIPGLLSAAAGRTVWLVALASAAAVVLAAVVFVRRPFGGDGTGTVVQLPRGPKLLYSVGFVGGTTYFTASAIALCRDWWSEPVAVAVALVALAGLGQLLLLRSLPLPALILRSVLATAVAALLPCCLRPAQVLGPLAAHGVPSIALAVAALLGCVGWEAIPRLRPDGRTVVVAVVCCALVMVLSCAWQLWAKSAGVGRSDSWDGLVGTLAALLFMLFAASNSAALAAFWSVGVPARKLRIRQVYAVVTVIVVLALLATTDIARAWILLLPGVATLALYLGFASAVWARAPQTRRAAVGG